MTTQSMCRSAPRRKGCMFYYPCLRGMHQSLESYLLLNRYWCTWCSFRTIPCCLYSFSSTWDFVIYFLGCFLSRVVNRPGDLMTGQQYYVRCKFNIVTIKHFAVSICLYRMIQNNAWCSALWCCNAMHICDELSQFGICTLASLFIIFWITTNAWESSCKIYTRIIIHHVNTKIQAHDDLLALSEVPAASTSA